MKRKKGLNKTQRNWLFELIRAYKIDKNNMVAHVGLADWEKGIVRIIGDEQKGIRHLI